MMPTEARFGVLAKWKQTMYRLGLRAALLPPKIVKCCAKPTIEQKAIGNKTTELNPENKFIKYTEVKFNVKKYE